MSRLTDLLAKLKVKDPALGDELEQEYRFLSSRRPYGLNFERHRPESVELPGRAARKGDKVRILPPRGSKAKDNTLWKVVSLSNVNGNRFAHVQPIGIGTDERTPVPVDDLIVVAESVDFIYPGLVSTGKVEHGGNKPFHTIINAENFHALEALTFTHRGKIDAVYIDPPYNSGARDWKYNNDYVEEDDLYRHSKWLAMMERRLELAGKLLRPDRSVLIVTIDEKEYLRLGLLLEQIFPESRIQMVSITISPRSTSRANEFSRVDEYAFFVFFGEVQMGSGEQSGNDAEIRWLYLRRTQRSLIRGSRPRQFYPVYVDQNSQKIVHIGRPMSMNDRIEDMPVIENAIAVYPIAPDGTALIWGLTAPSLQQVLDKGYVRVTPGNEQQPYTIAYASTDDIKRVERGEYVVTGTREDGSKIVVVPGGKPARPGTVWRETKHDAGAHGTSLLRSLIPGRSFPFPKSLYAVEDALRLFVEANPDAIILDFFAGSGTTAHAVMRLNHQDDGRRQCISITNNEVAAAEQSKLIAEGLRPGDPNWEKFGICDYVTKPRIAAAITGKTPDGAPVADSYKFTDEFPIADGIKENAEFFTLTYETPVSISHNRAFERIAPLLWMRAGSQGRRIDRLPREGWDVADAYGLLTDLDLASSFAAALRQRVTAHLAFIVTDDDRRFQSVARLLGNTVEPIRLYESYLSNFRFTTER